MIKRRTLLIAGAGSVAIAGLGAEALRRTAPAEMARAPWREAGQGFGDVRLNALSYAVLAPSPHNMQPWRVELERIDRFTLFCDRERLLPQTDPPGRQITIGFGCFLELARQAAAEMGFRADIDYFPLGASETAFDDRPIAHVALVEDAEVVRDPLFAHVLDRRTDRAPYDLARVPEQATLNQVAGASVDGVMAGFSSDPQLTKPLIKLARAAWEVEWALDRTRHESVAVTHIGGQAVDAAPFGINIDDRLISAMNLMGIVSLEDMNIPGTTTYQETQRFYDASIVATPAFIWTSTTDNSRLAQIAAGRAWVRMQLQANALGLGFHPLSQALQEFPEMRPHYTTVHDLLAPESGATVQMLARVGVGSAPPPAPRESLSVKIVYG